MFDVVKGQRTVVYIDSAYLQSAMQALSAIENLRLRIDFLKLKQYFLEHARTARLYFCIIVPSRKEKDEVSMRPVITWLEYNGYRIIERPPEKEWSRATNSIAPDLSVSAMQQARLSDTVVLFCGGNEYLALVQALKDEGKHVVLVASLKVPGLVADELRRAADIFVELYDVLRTYRLPEK